MPKQLGKSRKRAARKPRPVNKQKSNFRHQGAPTEHKGQTAHRELITMTPLFPSRVKQTLVYVENGLVATSGAGGIAGSYFFSANGMFDPNITGTGHQPLGFDQMMLMYNHYTVFASKISVRGINGSAANVAGGFGVYLSPDTTNITTISQIMENGLITWTTLLPISVYGSHVTLNLDCDVSSFYGRDKNSKELMEDANLFGTAAANPNDQVYFGLVCFDAVGGNVISVDIIVEIVYECFFWEPRKLTQS
jgi:hypothetical protein